MHAMATKKAPKTSTLIFPVGHYMGPFHPGPGEPVKHHTVRVGWQTPKLHDDDEYGVWAIAHGVVRRLDTTPWTRAVVEDTVRNAGVDEPARIVDALLERGLLAEVTPGTPQAVEFANAYRVQSLMVGLGNTPDEPLLTGIGLPGLPPAVRVEPFSAELWEWGHIFPNLWGVCTMFTEVNAEMEQPDADTDPESVLTRLLNSLHLLIAPNAMYLDAAREPASA